MQNEAAGPGAGFVYVQTNEPERNRVLAFRRAGDGTVIDELAALDIRFEYSLHASCRGRHR
jgi:hypothetical protein